jgi:hypothetical protein
MTARDEAIVVMVRNCVGGPVRTVTEEMSDALDAIPNDVLVRLAIERGALESVAVDERGELYRVVEP